MQNKNLKIIIGASLGFSGSCGYNRFEIGWVFAGYYLFKPTTFIQNCKYILIFA